MFLYAISFTMRYSTSMLSASTIAAPFNGHVATIFVRVEALLLFLTSFNALKDENE